jgi:hypothetical protein
MAQDQFEVKELSLFDASIGQTTEVHVIPLIADPTVSPGRQAPIGTIGVRTTGIAHQKTGAAATDWTAGSAIGGPTGGLSPAQHDLLDQLVHDIAENSYEELNYTGNVLNSVIIWTDSNKTTKIREWLYTYNGNRINTEVVKQYDGSGILIVGQTLTGTYSYSGNQLINITWVKT